jgi:hypothetical protein
MVGAGFKAFKDILVELSKALKNDQRSTVQVPHRSGDRGTPGRRSARRSGTPAVPVDGPQRESSSGGAYGKPPYCDPG